MAQTNTGGVTKDDLIRIGRPNGPDLQLKFNPASLIHIQGTTSQFGIYNSFGYSVGTSSGFFIYGTPSFNVGIHNTRSNKDNFSAVNDIFSPSGFIYDDNLYLLNF